MIREGKISQISSYLQPGTGSGMQSMDQHLLQPIKEDRLTPQAAYEKSIDKNVFSKMLCAPPLTG